MVIVDAAIDRGVANRDVQQHLSRLGFDGGAYRPLGVRIDSRDRLDDHLVRGLRDRYADRLEADLRRLRDAELDALDGAAAAVPP